MERARDSGEKKDGTKWKESELELRGEDDRETREVRRKKKDREKRLRRGKGSTQYAERKGCTWKGKKKGGAKGHSPPLRFPDGTAEWEREMAELGGGRKSRWNERRASGEPLARNGEKGEELVVVTPVGNDARKGGQGERGNSAVSRTVLGAIYHLGRRERRQAVGEEGEGNKEVKEAVVGEKRMREIAEEGR